MQSNILLFLSFSIIVAIIIHFLSPERKKYGLFCLNIIFYLICDAKFLVLILISTLWSYLWSHIIEMSATKKILKLYLGIIPIIIILAFFKYYNFFVPNDIDNSITILMPLGISYYSFKIISYVADVYLNKRNAESSFVNYCIYISFFPQIICGPISRSSKITNQLNHLAPPSSCALTQGYMYILSGLFKKLVIADRLNPYTNIIFSDPSSYPSLALWIAAFFYAIQIYCDFAGYSEIAIGVSNLLGIECDANFNFPYFSKNIKDFWQRWHISLSSWLRDYIYIPLGGNKKGNLRKNINILFTFLISGIWHGNSLNFICWGLWHGFLNLIPIRKKKKKITNCFMIILNFICIMFGWILFKSSTLTHAMIFIEQMFVPIDLSFSSIVNAIIPFTGDYSCLAYLLTVCLFVITLFFFEKHELSTPAKENTAYSCFKCMVYLSGLILFGTIGQNSFLYANF